jgi:CDP-glucose 4,6-dehydratase
LVPEADTWRGRRVLLTGHTGFKGAWLALWLAELGAEVHGLSGPPPSDQLLFDQARVKGTLASHHEVDVRDADAVAAAMSAARPEVVIHMAAQAIVRQSLVDPAGTWAINVVGTANLLQALTGDEAAVVVVTSDKCYRDIETGRPMTEDDPLGGKDPYSASKAAQELVARAHRDTFGGRIATARAGNVIGGGDWAKDRLIPDVMRARGDTVVLRNPDAVRPWQHVLNPLSGYLALAAALMRGDDVAEAWNFGPPASDALPVQEVVERLGVPYRVEADPDAGKESVLLRLDSTKARERLGWTPAWDIEAGLKATAEWYASATDPRQRTTEQIAEFAAIST